MSEPKTRADYEAEIAHLEGQVEAYQNQVGSMAIEVLRMKVKDLEDKEAARERASRKQAKQLGELEGRMKQAVDALNVRLAAQREWNEHFESQLLAMTTRIEALERANETANGTRVVSQGGSGGRAQGSEAPSNGAQGHGD